MANSRFGPDTPPQELVDDIRRRLAGVCADWPPELFAEMTTRAAWIEFKYDRALTEGFSAAAAGDAQHLRERSMSL